MQHGHVLTRIDAADKSRLLAEEQLLCMHKGEGELPRPLFWDGLAQQLHRAPSAAPGAELASRVSRATFSPGVAGAMPNSSWVPQWVID